MSRNYNEDTDATDARVMLEAGMVLAQAESLGEGSTPYIVMPKDAMVYDLERLLPAPLVIRLDRNLHTPDAFIRYVRAFREPGTMIFFDEDERRFKAILDHHRYKGLPKAISAEEEGEDLYTYEPAEPRWGGHTATCTVEHSREWAIWAASNKRQMSQVAFAQFLEDNDRAIATDQERDTLMAVALALEIKKDVKFNNALTLKDGSVKLTFSEDVQGSVRGGEVAIPPTFAISIPIFKGEESVLFLCRLRYRLNDRTAMLWYDITRMESEAEAALARISAAIASATGVPVLEGAA